MSNLKNTPYAIKCHRCMDKSVQVKRLCSTCEGTGLLPVYNIHPDAKDMEIPKDAGRKVLKLKVSKEKFNNIKSGEQKEIQLEVKAYWSKTLDGSHTHASLTIAYLPFSPTALFKIKSLSANGDVFIIALGERIKEEGA